MRSHRKKPNDSLQKFLIGVGLIAVVVLMLANSQSGFLGFAFKSLSKEILPISEETIAISPTPTPTPTATVSLVPIDEPLVSQTPSASATPIPTISSTPIPTSQPNENYPYAAKGLSSAAASNPLQKTYIYAGNLVASFSSDSQGKAQYYVQDHLGSSRKVIGSALEEQTNEFYAFGENGKATGSGNDYKYTGKEFDDESGLYYYGARYYDPDLGRFVSADPLKGSLKDPMSMNRYTYVKNNPIKYYDPTGNAGWSFLEQLQIEKVAMEILTSFGGQENDFEMDIPDKIIDKPRDVARGIDASYDPFDEVAEASDDYTKFEKSRISYDVDVELGNREYLHGTVKRTGDKLQIALHATGKDGSIQVTNAMKEGVIKGAAYHMGPKNGIKSIEIIEEFGETAQVTKTIKTSGAFWQSVSRYFRKIGYWIWGLGFVVAIAEEGQSAELPGGAYQKGGIIYDKNGNIIGEKGLGSGGVEDMLAPMVPRQSQGARAPSRHIRTDHMGEK